jgi:hypothetical protein
MERYKIAPKYSIDYLEVDRPQTLSDRRIESLIKDVVTGKMNSDITDKVYIDFSNLAHDYIFNSSLNILTGIDSFPKVDIMNGCTQFIDTIYMKGPVQTLENDYRYHYRLNPNLEYSVPGKLKKNIPLIIAMPFPSLGDIHGDMENILDECFDKGIHVHIDGAWITCSNGIKFDFSHLAIRSVSVSLSKGLGLGWNRIGLRYAREQEPDAISIMNDFHMNNRALCIIGNHFLTNLPKDYLWTEHKHRYYKICDDFNLTPTKSIHIAMSDNNPVGIAPLIRYLEEHGT